MFEFEDPADQWKKDRDDRKRDNPQKEAWVRYYERCFDGVEELKTDPRYREIYLGFKRAESGRDYGRALDFASAIWYAWYGFNGKKITESGEE